VQGTITSRHHHRHDMYYRVPLNIPAVKLSANGQSNLVSLVGVEPRADWSSVQPTPGGPGSRITFFHSPRRVHNPGPEPSVGRLGHLGRPTRLTPAQPRRRDLAYTIDLPISSRALDSGDH